MKEKLERERGFEPPTLALAMHSGHLLRLGVIECE